MTYSFSQRYSLNKVRTMKVSTLIELLDRDSDTEFEYFGAVDVEFPGLEIRARRPAVKGRFGLLLDSNWSEKRWRRYGYVQNTVPSIIARSLMRGAVGFVVPQELYTAEVEKSLSQQNYFLVEDSLEFVLEVARVCRDEELDVPLTAITGSAGKSTTSAMLTHALAGAGIHDVLSSEDNQNMFEAVACQLTQAPHHSHAVIETSSVACRFFQRRNLSLAADVSVVTSIGDAHTEMFGSVRNIALAKAGVFDNPPPAGTAVICLDTEFASLLVKRAYEAGRQVITYGESPNAAIRLVKYDQTSGKVVAAIGNEQLSYTVGAEGRHMALNSLAVVAVLRAHRIRNWRKGIESLATFRPVQGRGETVKMAFPNGVRVSVINEAYNSNPASLCATLAMFSTKEVSPENRKVAILGDVLELGDSSAAIHKSLADPVRQATLDQVILFGPEMGVLHRELEDSGFDAPYFSSLDALTSSLPELLLDGDMVLAKASGGTGLKDWIKANAV